MNVDRLLREAEKRLSHLDEGLRADVLDVFREEITKERRRLDPGLTVEAERERRVEAETLREVRTSSRKGSRTRLPTAADGSRKPRTASTRKLPSPSTSASEHESNITTRESCFRTSPIVRRARSLTAK